MTKSVRQARVNLLAAEQIIGQRATVLIDTNISSMMNSRLKNKKFWLLLGFSLMLSACQTLPTKNIDTNVQKSTMQDTRKVIDTYRLIEKDNNLYFMLTLTNNTAKIVEVSSTISPYNVSTLDYRSVEPRNKTTIRSHEEIIKIEPNSSYTFEFNVSEKKELKAGEHTYILTYFFNRDMDMNEIKRLGIKKVKDDLAIYHFTWFREPNSIKGKLISYDVID